MLSLYAGETQAPLTLITEKDDPKKQILRRSAPQDALRRLRQVERARKRKLSREESAKQSSNSEELGRGWQRFTR
jgi:hypothetical protein